MAGLNIDRDTLQKISRMLTPGFKNSLGEGLDQTVKGFDRAAKITSAGLLGDDAVSGGINSLIGGGGDDLGGFYSQFSQPGADFKEDQQEMSGLGPRINQNIQDRYTQNEGEGLLGRGRVRRLDRFEDRPQNRGMRMHNRANIAEQLGMQGRADRLNNRAGNQFARSLERSDNDIADKPGGLLMARLRGLLGR